MTVQYYETSPQRVIAVIDAVGDVTPFIGVGVSDDATVNHGFKTAPRTDRKDEILRLGIRRVTQGGTVTGARITASVIGGAWATAAGIASNMGNKSRIQLTTNGVIDASFAIVWKRWSDVVDAEAIEVARYLSANFGGLNSIVDESDGAAGYGYYAVQCTALTSGQYAVQLIVDDTD